MQPNTHDIAYWTLKKAPGRVPDRAAALSALDRAISARATPRRPASCDAHNLLVLLRSARARGMAVADRLVELAGSTTDPRRKAIASRWLRRMYPARRLVRWRRRVWWAHLERYLDGSRALVLIDMDGVRHTVSAAHSEHAEIPARGDDLLLVGADESLAQALTAATLIRHSRPSAVRALVSPCRLSKSISRALDRLDAVDAARGSEVPA